MVKNSPADAGDEGSIPGLGRSPGEGKGNPLQYSGLENSMDCMAHGVAKSRAHLSDFHFELPNSNSVKRLPWWLSGKEFTCQCRKYGFNPSVKAIPWKKKGQPTLVF